MRERARLQTRGTRFRSRLLLALFLGVVLHPRSSSAQQVRPTEFQVKAAYLYNFGKFVRWQASTASATDSFEICVIGKNPFGSALEGTVAGEKIDGKTLIARNISNPQEASRCRILFISESEEGHLKSILGIAKQFGELTVSDIPDFAERGGMIEFLSQDGKIRFEVNLTPAREAGLTVSSELLKVAVKVIGSNRTKEIER